MTTAAIKYTLTMNDWRDYDWSDVKPLPVPDVPGHVAQIAYSADFRDAMALFRAVMAAHELSERALALTTGVIKLNPAHYSVWDYRLEVCETIGNRVFDYRAVGLTPESASPPPIGDNGEWLNMFTLANAKNYQVWNYRQHLLDAENPLWFKNERLVVAMVLEDDAKNFHAWSHLKWCITRGATAFDPEELLGWAAKLLADDVLNNSVWSFRHFVLHLYPQARSEAELSYVLAQISEQPENESVWSYLTGLLALMPDLKPAAVQAAEPYTHTGQARAVEFLAENSRPAEAREYYKKLAQLEPARKEFWITR